MIRRPIAFEGSGGVGFRPRKQPPPGGDAGAAQQVPATLATMSLPPINAGYAMFSNGRKSAGSTPRKRRRKSAKAAPARRRRRSASRSKRAKFVKGSAAAKKHMAKLRRMRRK